MDATPDYADPIITAENRPHWEAAEEGRLVLQHCPRCDRFWFPIGPVCPFCLGSDFEWKEVSGRGEVATWVIFRRKYLPGFEVPYNVAQVTLAEGPRLTTVIVDTPLEKLHIGMPVSVRFQPLAGRRKVPVFAPATE